MTLPTLAINYAGNVPVADGFGIAYDSQVNGLIAGGSTKHPRIVAGTGAPTFTAPKGSLYLRVDGSSVATRIYVNTDSATTWTNVTTAA